MANGYINALSAIGIGDSSGAVNSLNNMVGIKRTTAGSGGGPYDADTTDSKPVNLKKWFEKYAIAPELATGVYTNVKWSEFHQSTIFGAIVQIQNETTSHYSDSNNGAININPINGSLGRASSVGGGSAGTFTIIVRNGGPGGTFRASSTGTGSQTIGGHSGLFDSGTYYVTITNTHPTGASIPSMTFGFYWTNALGGSGGMIRSDPTDPNSFNNLSNGAQISINPTSQASGFSDPVTLLCKPQSFENP